MSKWQEYGFPNGGTHIQIACEGLLAALTERCNAVGIEIPENLQSCVSKNQFIESFDEFIEYKLGYFYMPNGRPCYIRNMAEYIGEPLLNGILGAYFPFSDWFLQRYKFLNLIYDFCPYGNDLVAIKGVYQGFGDTRLEALNDYHGKTYEEKTIYSIKIEDSYQWGNVFPYDRLASVDRRFEIAKKIKSKINAKSANIKCFATVSAYESETYDRKYYFYDFGTGLKKNEKQVIFDFNVSDVKIGDYIEVQSAMLDTLADNIVGMSFPNKLQGYSNGVVSRNMEAGLTDIHHDLRQSFDFYDEIKVE